jgi:hypothetical protein
MTAQEGRLREENVRMAAELRRIAALSAQGAYSEFLWAALKGGGGPRQVRPGRQSRVAEDLRWGGLNIDAAASQFGISEARESDG